MTYNYTLLYEDFYDFCVDVLKTKMNAEIANINTLKCDDFVLPELPPHAVSYGEEYRAESYGEELMVYYYDDVDFNSEDALLPQITANFNMLVGFKDASANSEEAMSRKLNRFVVAFLNAINNNKRRTTFKVEVTRGERDVFEENDALFFVQQLTVTTIFA
jgi:hypothetical protein